MFTASEFRGFIRSTRSALLSPCVGILVLLLAPVRGETFYIDAVVPAPKSVEYGRWNLFPGDEVERRDLRILLPGDPSKLEIAAANLLRDRLIELGVGTRDIQLVEEGRLNDSDQVPALEVAIGTGRRNSAINRVFESLLLPPLGRPEAYRIRTVRDPRGHPQYLLQGSDDRGSYYAAVSLSQMLTLQRGQLAVRSLQIDDWPTFRSRASGNDEKPPPEAVAAEAVDWFARFKMNAWPLGQSYHWPEDWREMPEESMRVIRSAARRASVSALNLRYQIHPFGRGNDPEGRNTIRISSEDDRAVFFQSISRAVRSGAVEILVRADDFHQLAEEDRQEFPSKAAAHALLINETYERILRIHPEVRFFFCPPYYWGNQIEQDTVSRQYIREIGRALHPDIPILWTGPEVISDTFSAEEQERFNAMAGRSTLLWDNTVYQEKSSFGYRYIHAVHWLDLLDTDYPENLPGLLLGIRFNFGFEDSWINRIGNIVLADFLWNPEAFDAAQSRKRAVGLCLGARIPDAYLALVRQIRDVFDLMHSPARWANGTIPSPASFAASVRELRARTTNQRAMDELEELWSRFESSRIQLRELENYFGGLANRSEMVFMPGRAGEWLGNQSEHWKIRQDRSVAMFTFPYETSVQAGSFASISKPFSLEGSQDKRFFLHFVFDDDYRNAGSPPRAYPGYFFKQVLIDGEVVWEDDVVGDEPIGATTIEVTRPLRGKQKAEITVRCIDKLGVTNLGVRASVSPIFLTAF